MASELVEHLRDHALRTDGPFTLRSGRVSDWYLDARLTTFDGPGGLLVGRVVLRLLEDRVTALGGMTLGADPIAVSTAVVAAGEGRRLRAFSVRKRAKDHGAGGRIVGPVAPGDRAAVLEDTTTTGGALLEAVDVVAAAGIEIVQAIVLVDRSGGAAAGLLAARGIPLSVVATPRDLGVPA